MPNEKYHPLSKLNPKEGLIHHSKLRGVSLNKNCSYVSKQKISYMDLRQYILYKYHSGTIINETILGEYLKQIVVPLHYQNSSSSSSKYSGKERYNSSGQSGR